MVVFEIHQILTDRTLVFNTIDKHHITLKSQITSTK
jgi:hypothetical protein